MMGEHEETLWRLYVDHKDNHARQELIAKYEGLAKAVAAKQYSVRVSDDVEFDDYVQFAYIGLLEAIDRYDLAQGVMFNTFAGYRIKGSIVSGIRQLSERREQAAFQARVKRDRVESINTESSASATRDELFNEMVELSVGLAIGFMLDDVDIVQHAAQGSEDSTFKSGLYNQLKLQLAEFINELPERERLIIRYHYFCQLNFQEIAKILELGKSRVAQLHKRALQLIHKAIRSRGELDDYF